MQTIIISTRSGTNSVHGSAFETARNSAIGVARRRQDSFTKAPHLVRNEFGASVGGNGFRDSLMQEPNVFLPGAVPADFDARNRFLFYQRDTALPKHRFRWNWLIDRRSARAKPWPATRVRG